MIIPYQSYSLPFILRVLDLYFNHRDTIAGICERFGIIGRYMNGGFICIPALGICSDLTDYSDTFWNTEKLKKVLSPVDAVTVANGISTLKHIKDDLGRYSPFPV